MRNADAAFLSMAEPHQAIKLPRQHNVDKDEYREFLNLGHGEIFNLDLDRWGGGHKGAGRIDVGWGRGRQVYPAPCGTPPLQQGGEPASLMVLACCSLQGQMVKLQLAHLAALVSFPMCVYAG